MKKFTIVYVFSLLVGWTVDAHAQLPVFNTVNYKSYLTGLNSAGWRSNANDADTAGLLIMFSHHFTLSAHDSSDFQQQAVLDPDFKSILVLCCKRVANQLDSGRTLDLSGTNIVDNGTGYTASTAHADLVISWCCPVTCAVSFWFTKSRNN